MNIVRLAGEITSAQINKCGKFIVHRARITDSHQMYTNTQTPISVLNYILEVDERNDTRDTIHIGTDIDIHIGSILLPAYPIHKRHVCAARVCVCVWIRMHECELNVRLPGLPANDLTMQLIAYKFLVLISSNCLAIVDSIKSLLFHPMLHPLPIFQHLPIAKVLIG